LFQDSFQEKIQIPGFDATEKFLECGEVSYCCETEEVPDTIHLFEVPDECAVVFLPIFLEKKEGQQLTLRIISSRIFAGIRCDTR
jgi:hypothetical protein